MKSLPRQYIVNEKGKRISVIIPLSEYQQMQEDLHDLAAIADRKDERSLTINEMKTRL